MLLMMSLPVADCSTLLPMQWGMLDRQWCVVESVVRQVSRLTMTEDVVIQ